MDILNKSCNYRIQFCNALSFIKREGKVTQDKEIKPLEEKVSPKSLIRKRKRGKDEEKQEQEEEGWGKVGGW